MLKKSILATTLVLSCVLSAFADQAAYISKTQAEKAVAFLKGKKEIRHYCSPCSDKGDRTDAVTSVDASVVPDSTEGWWEVKVNGEGIDLAYVYFKTNKGKWKNLAKELDVKVDGVPKYLPSK